MQIPFKNIPAVNIVFVGSKLAANESQIGRQVGAFSWSSIDTAPGRLDSEKAGIIQSIVPHCAQWQLPGQDG